MFQMFDVFLCHFLKLCTEPLPVPLGLPVSWCLCVSTSTNLCQVSLFATSLASRICVPTIFSLMCLAFTTLAL